MLSYADLAKHLIGSAAEQLKKLPVQPVLDVTCFPSLAEISFTLVQVDPPVGGTVANASQNDGPVLSEGLYSLWWGIIPHAGATSNYWAPELVVGTSRYSFGRARTHTLGVLQTFELGPVYVPPGGWRQGWTNTTSLADADVTNLYFRAIPYTR